MNLKFTLGLILLTFAMYVLADGYSDVEHNLDWYVDNHKSIHKQLRNGSDDEVAPIIEVILDLWKHRDGAIGSEISPAMAEALIHHPELTFSWFAENKGDFDEWVRRIPYDLLTNYSSSEKIYKEIILTRERLIDAMKTFSRETDNVEHMVMAVQLQNKLEENPVREIE